MHVVWIPSSGPLKRCFVGVCATRVWMGVCASRSKVRTVATIELEYTISDLLLISGIMRAMRENRMVPEVYLWDRLSSAPELAVVFRLAKPELSIMEEVMGEPVAGVARPVGCSEIIVTGEANISRTKGVMPFLAMFETHQICQVLVSEDSEATCGDQPAAFIFDVTSVNNRDPTI